MVSLTNMSVDLNKRGVDFILYLQKQPIFTGNWENFWLLCTKSGDPSWVFLVYAPLLYPVFGHIVIKFMLAGAFSEFFNGVFKCNSKRTNFIRWFAYFSFLSLIALSRLYVATHFPHQVLLGITIGLIIGMIVYRTPWTVFRLKFCIKASGLLLLMAALTFLGLEMYGVDPNWSIGLALKWCHHKEWVRMSTTPLASLFRDIGALLGFGLSAELRDVSRDYNPDISLGKKCLSSFLSWLLAQFTISCFPQVDWLPLFYAVTCCQYFVISITVFYAIPQIFNKKDEEKREKTLK